VKRKSTSPSLLSILAFERIAGFGQTLLLSNWGYANANGIESAEGLD